MSLPMSTIRQIYEALDREPGWKLVVLEASADAFREWLRRVRPDVFHQICESAEDVLWHVLG